MSKLYKPMLIRSEQKIAANELVRPELAEKMADWNKRDLAVAIAGKLIEEGLVNFTVVKDIDCHTYKAEFYILKECEDSEEYNKGLEIKEF